MYKAVFTDHVFNDISGIRKILNGIADVFEYQCTNEEEVISVSRDADALLVVNYLPITKNIIQNMTKCKIISRFGIGVDSVDIKYASSKGIYVTNVPDYCIDEVSDHAIAMMMHLERRLNLADKLVRETFEYNPQKLYLPKGLNGATLGIIGFGRIGKLTAKKLINFGMRVLFYDPFINEDIIINEEKVYKSELAALVGQSDYIIIHAPYTEKNYHLIDEKMLCNAKNAPIIINVGRGELVDTKALIKFLKNGRVYAAGLDVLENNGANIEDSEILNMDNVLLSPHSAWQSVKALKKLQTGGAQAVVQALTGEIPTNCVNTEMLRENLQI